MKGYKPIITADGSQTMYSPYFDENCHSTDGAKSETIHTYWKGCRVEGLLSNHQQFTILEVGLGTGLGLYTTIELLEQYMERAKTQCQIQFLTTEIDPVMIELFFQSFFQRYGQTSNKSWERIGSYWQWQCHPWLTVTIFVGDAMDTLSSFQEYILYPVRAIYQDAFSPKKNPKLWSWQWFHLLKCISTKDVILSTYCASAAARKSMHQAGWAVSNAPAFGRKKNATLATLTGTTTQQVWEQIRSDKIIAFDYDK